MQNRFAGHSTFMRVVGFLLAAITSCPRPHLAACDPPTRPVILREGANQEQTSQTGTPGSARDEESPKYEQGYDPLKTHRNQVRVLPDEAWGKVVNGLQAAISGPDKIRFSEVATYYLVLRNVTQETIRVSLPNPARVVSIRRKDSRGSYPVNSKGDSLQGWELQPGHQINIPFPPIQVLTAGDGDLALRDALRKVQPGMYTLYARIGAGGEQWVTDADGRRHIFIRPKDEWTGWLSPVRHPFEVLAEKVPFEIAPLEDLPDGHGLKYVLGSPPSLSKGHTEWIRLRYGLEFALDSSKDAHWLRDSGTNNRLVFWGPIPAARLKDLKLIDPIRQLSHQYIQTARHQSQIDHRIAVLVRSQQPLAEMGLNFVPTMPKRKPTPGGHIPSDYLVRTIRDRRVELENMGLAVPMSRAVDILARNDAPMPDDSQFRVIHSKELPDGLEEKAWGPKNAGLQAAALMPDSISAEATEEVRLFIRNVSKQDVRLAVSERAGYDYATAVDGDGNQLTAIRPYAHRGGGFSGGFLPEVNPGQSTQSPPTATLQKVILKPGAVLELATKAGLSFHLRERGIGSFLGLAQEDGKPAVTHISAKPTTARVTWHLHTANGAANSKDLKRRLWPAKGSWSGILTTAPTEINLQR